MAKLSHFSSIGEISVTSSCNIKDSCLQLSWPLTLKSGFVHCVCFKNFWFFTKDTLQLFFSPPLQIVGYSLWTNFLISWETFMVSQCCLIRLWLIINLRFQYELYERCRHANTKIQKFFLCCLNCQACAFVCTLDAYTKFKAFIL